VRHLSQPATTGRIDLHFATCSRVSDLPFVSDPVAPPGPKSFARMPHGGLWCLVIEWSEAACLGVHFRLICGVK